MLSFPTFFFFLLGGPDGLRVRLKSVDSNPSFLLADSDLLRGGDPFSHPSGSSAPAFEFPFLKVLFSELFDPVADHWIRHPIPIPGSRKRSVPVRVHSVSKELWFAAASRPSASNLPLTHGTVESPAKLFSTVKVLEECGRLQSVPRALTNPFHWLTTALQIQFCTLIANCGKTRFGS